MPEIIHVLNRGTDKRQIFLNDKDRLRFIHDLYELNDENQVGTEYQRYCDDIQCRHKLDRPRKILVDIHAFALMPNHYHLLLSAQADRGIPRFMHKINMGYSKYFNIKYERKGTLFEGKYHRVSVNSEAHFIHLPYYIHCNPLDLRFPEWRNREINNYQQILDFLETYRWSSHLDYLGKNNFPSVITKDFLLEFFDGTDGYRQKITDWFKTMNLEELAAIKLEK